MQLKKIKLCLRSCLGRETRMLYPSQWFKWQIKPLIVYLVVTSPSVVPKLNILYSVVCFADLNNFARQDSISFNIPNPSYSLSAHEEDYLKYVSTINIYNCLLIWTYEKTKTFNSFWPFYENRTRLLLDGCIILNIKHSDRSLSDVNISNKLQC